MKNARYAVVKTYRVMWLMAQFIYTMINIYVIIADRK